MLTDGCSYRRDRVPACTFRECLEQQPDYPLRHADDSSGLSFYDTAEIPDDDANFNAWFRGHVSQFFEVEPSVAERLVMHTLEHKLTGTTGSPSFDAMACDGSANNMKLLCTNGRWSPQESKMRGYGRESKQALEPWIVETYSSNALRDLAPVAVDSVLMKLEPAMNAARRALEAYPYREALLPLGLPHGVVKAYSVIKPNAYICRTPQQYRALKRQVARLQREVGCGMDLLALRRPYGSTDGSLSRAASRIYEFIATGRYGFTAAFNLRPERLSSTSDAVLRARRETIDALRHEANTTLQEVIFCPDALTTGIRILRKVSLIEDERGPN